MLLTWASQQARQAPLPVPFAASDFANGVYSLNGAPKAVGDMWINIPAWAAPFDPATDIVPGKGVYYSGDANNGPCASPDLYAAVPVDGFTAVMKGTILADVGGGAITVAYSDYNITNGAAAQISFFANHTPIPSSNPSYAYDAVSGSSTDPFLGTAGEHKMAFTLSPTGLAYSLDGSAARTVDGAFDWSGVQTFAMWFATGDDPPMIELSCASLDIYAVQDPGILHRLSA